MAKLVANSHGSMYNGVSQQPPHMRSSSQVEESYNANHSLEYGLIRREPLEQPDGSSGTTPIMSNVYDESYSNMIIDGNSVYQININNGIPMLVQLKPYYKILRVGDGISISTDASWYLSQRRGTFKRTQFATTTIKNTTLIANDAVIPRTYESGTNTHDDRYALVWFKHADAALGIDYCITIGGRKFCTASKDRSTDNKSYGCPGTGIGGIPAETYYPMPNPPNISGGGVMYDDELKIQVRPGTTTPVYVYAHNWMSAGEISSYQAYVAAIDARNMALQDLGRARSRRIQTENQQDKLDAWIRQDIKGPTTTADAARDLYTQIRDAGYICSVSGSVLYVDAKKKDVYTSDSFGNTAMALFYREIPGVELLPQEVPSTWKHLKFKVKQETTDDKAAFWAHWNGSIWEETQAGRHVLVREKTMPIEMRVAFHNNGSIANVVIGIRQWDDRKVGDTSSNPGPKFFNRLPIRDIFFYRNRLGFLSDEGITMSESGDHSNLWRTTALTTLDSDPIDFVVSTTSSTSLRHTVMNQDKVFILADNVQFVMDGGAVFSPKSVRVNEVSHYVLNLDIQPIVTDNKIVFMGGTDKSAIVYEYAYNESLGIAEANALTAHVPGYILNDVNCLAASNEDSMIFVVASDHRERLLPRYGDDTTMFRDMYDGSDYSDSVNYSHVQAYPDRKILYVYKYADSGGKKVQSAWSKWNYRGSVLQVSAAHGMLYMDIDHEIDFDQEFTVIGSGEWRMSGDWNHQGMSWNMTRHDYLTKAQLQRRFARQALTPPFIEGVTGEYEVSTSILGDDTAIIHDYRDFGQFVNRTFVDIGEFVFKDRASKTYTASNSKLKSLRIKSDPGSLHTVIIRNQADGTERAILPQSNKKFSGIGLASNYFLFNLGETNVTGRDRVAGLKFDESPILDTQPIIGDERGEEVVAGGDLVAGFDSAQIANLGNKQPMSLVNKKLPNLYGVDVPIMVGGRSESTRVIISSFYNKDRDYGFRIHDIIQEAKVNQRYNLS